MDEKRLRELSGVQLNEASEDAIYKKAYGLTKLDFWKAFNKHQSNDKFLKQATKFVFFPNDKNSPVHVIGKFGLLAISSIDDNFGIVIVAGSPYIEDIPKK